GHINEFYVTIRLRIGNRTVTQSQSLRRSTSANSRPHFRPQDSSLRVKSRHVQRKTACPLYPQKRTCASHKIKSALGQKPTLHRLIRSSRPRALASTEAR